MSDEVNLIETQPEAPPGLDVASRRFRVTLRRVARLSALRGDINLADWWKVSGVTWNPIRKTSDGVKVDLMQEVTEEVVMQAMAAGVLAENVSLPGIDWDAIIEWLTQIMPLILEFIKALLLLF